jgi:RHS repeat-associated protein
MTSPATNADAAGDLTWDGLYSYTWNAEGLLSSAAGVTYTYDGDLRRVAKSNGTLYWYCATCGRVLAESDSSGNITSEYTYFGDQRIARRDVASGNVYYLFSDRLGSYRTLTDSSGNVKGESDYYPFGGERVISSTVTDSFRFAGMEWDPEDGLNHTLYRKFSPALGRWQSPDPVRGCVNFPQGQNLYGYVKDNPTNAVDSNGDQVGEGMSCSQGFEGGYDPCTCCRTDPAFWVDYEEMCSYECGVYMPPGSGGGVGGGGGTGTCTVTQWPQGQYPPEIFAGNECAKNPKWVEMWAWNCKGDESCCLQASDAASRRCEEEGRLKGRYWSLEPAPGLEINYACCCDEGARGSPPPPPPPKPKPKPPKPRPGG